MAINRKELTFVGAIDVAHDMESAAENAQKLQGTQESKDMLRARLKNITGVGNIITNMLGASKIVNATTVVNKDTLGGCAINVKNNHLEMHQQDNPLDSLSEL